MHGKKTSYVDHLHKFLVVYYILCTFYNIQGISIGLSAMFLYLPILFRLRNHYNYVALIYIDFGDQQTHAFNQISINISFKSFINV